MQGKLARVALLDARSSIFSLNNIETRLHLQSSGVSMPHAVKAWVCVPQKSFHKNLL